MHPDMGDAVHSIVTETRHRVGSTAVLGERSGLRLGSCRTRHTAPNSNVWTTLT